MITDEMKKHPRWKELHIGVGDDGIIEDRDIETYVAFPMAVYCPNQYGYTVASDGKYVSFIVDNGGTDLEVRLPWETVEMMARKVAESKALAGEGGSDDK